MSIIERIPGPGKTEVGEAEYVFKYDDQKRAVARVGNLTDEICLLGRKDLFRKIDDSAPSGGGQSGGGGGGVKASSSGGAGRRSGTGASA